MNSVSGKLRAPTPWRERLLRSSVSRIVAALLAIAVPFAAVAIPFNLYVSDKLLKKAGAVLLTLVVVSAYSGYVRLVEKRSVAELSGPHAVRELGAGMLLGALLLSVTIAVLAALGVYRVTGNNGWLAMLATVPGFILAAVLEEVVMRGVVFRILEQSLGSWLALALSAVIFGALHLLNPADAAQRRRRHARGRDIAGGSLHAYPTSVAVHGHPFRLELYQGGIFSAAVSGGATQGCCRRNWSAPSG